MFIYLCCFLEDGSILSTRELINRDKKSYKMKLFSIDELELDVCQDYLKVTQKLKKKQFIKKLM